MYTNNNGLKEGWNISATRVNIWGGATANLKKQLFVNREPIGHRGLISKSISGIFGGAKL